MRVLPKITLLLIAALAGRVGAVTNDLATFSGTVVDSRGKPVVDAVVECFHFPTRVVAGTPDIESKQFKASDTNGAYEFSVPSGAVTVVAKKPAFASGWKTWQSAPEGEVSPLVLAAPSTLAGIVVDENDHPVANAVVSVSAAADRGKGDWAKQPNFLFGKAAKDLFSATTSADGHFRILNFPAGAQATLEITAPGKALRSSGANGMQLQAQAGQEDIKLVTDATASIEGKVLRRDTGEPLANAKIELGPVNAGGGIAVSGTPAQSGADGSFRIEEVPPGSYRIAAVFTNQPIPSWVTASVPVAAGPGEAVANVRIEAFKGGVVELTVVGKGDQRIVPDANVSAYGEGYPASGSTGTNGVAWFRLPPGQFILFGKKQGVAQATVAEGTTNHVTLELDMPAASDVLNAAVKIGAPSKRETVSNPLAPGVRSQHTFVSRRVLLMVLVGISSVVFWFLRKQRR
jgi:uncharacterized GH25 family protein